MAASTTPLDGSMYLVSVSTDDGSTWDVLGFQKESNFSIATESREITSKTQCAYREKVPTVSTWTISGTAEFYNNDATDLVYNDLFDLRGTSVMLKVTPVICSSGDPATGEFEYSGSGFFSQLDASFPEKETASYAYTFEGSGTLTKAAIV